MGPQEVNRRSAVTESVIRDLEGAGLLSHPKVDRQAIIDGLLRGDAEDPNVVQYRQLQRIVDPDTELKGYENAIYGIPPEELRRFAHRDFQGRGWSKEDMWRLGRDVQSRELSPGSRQAQEWERRRNLADGMIEAKTPGFHNLPLPGLVALRTALTETPEAAFERTRNAKFGESGYAGALENPEYLAGDFFTRYGDPMAAYFQYRLNEDMDGDEADKLAQQRTQAAKMSNTIATKIPHNMDTSTPQSKEDSYKAVRGIYRDLSPKSTDNEIRERTGQYPSYAYSTADQFLTNLADPTTFVGIGHGLYKMANGVLGALGRNVLKDSLLEEIPTAAGIGGLFGAYKSIPAKPFTPGNEARTDLYNPETGQPETDKEFQDKMAKRQTDRRNAKQNFETYQNYGHPLMTR
jgi:hypothetical protein